MIHESGSIPSSKQKGAPRSQTKWKTLLGKKRQIKEVILAKNRWFQTRLPSFGGQWGSIKQNSLLVLTRKFQTDCARLRSWERLNVISLSIKAWFHDMGLRTSDSIWGLLSLFKNLLCSTLLSWPHRRWHEEYSKGNRKIMGKYVSAVYVERNLFCFINKMCPQLLGE